MFRFLDTTLLRAPEDGAGGGSFFQEGAGGQQTQQTQQSQTQQGGDQGKGGGDGRQASRPDWLLPKYNSIEDQAKGYSELFGQFSKKTEDLRKDVLADAVKEYGKSIGVPDDVKGYAYPEGYQAPAENVDAALRGWAKKHNVSPAGFQELVKDVHGLTVANHAAEKQKLGEKADERIAEVNRWVNANVDKAHFGQVAKLMTTADGIAFIESIIDGKRDGGFVSGDEGDGAAAPLTREAIRAMQADPRFGPDEAYTKMVRGKWADYARLPADKRK